MKKDFFLNGFAAIATMMGVEEEIENEKVTTETMVDTTVVDESDVKSSNSSITDKNNTADNKELSVIESKETVKEDDKLDVPNINYDDFRPIFNFENLSDDEIIDAALNRLMQDSYFGINGLPLIACFIYVYNKAKKDIDFSKKVLLKSKNFTKCFEYLSKQVQSMCNGTKGIGLDHRQIFAIIDDYYELNDLEIAKKEAEAKAKQKKKNQERLSKTKKKVDKKTSEKSKEKKEENSFNLFSQPAVNTSASKDEPKKEDGTKKENNNSLNLFSMFD